MTDGADAPQPTMHESLAVLADDLGGLEVAAQVVDIYLAELPGRMDRVRGSEGAGIAGVARAAHSLKSASALVGLFDVSARAAELEAALIAPGATPRPDLVDALLEVATATEPALRAWRDAITTD